jgi:hypothetical protein
MLRASLGKAVHTVKKAGTYAAKVPAQELHKIAVRVRAVIRSPKKTLEGIEHILISLQRETAIFINKSRILSKKQRNTKSSCGKLPGFCCFQHGKRFRKQRQCLENKPKYKIMLVHKKNSIDQSTNRNLIRVACSRHNIKIVTHNDLEVLVRYDHFKHREKQKEYL